MNLNNTYFLRYRALTFFLFALLIGISYFYLDRPIALFFYQKNLIGNSALTLLAEVVSPMCNLVIWPVIFYILRFWKKDVRNSNRALLITLSVACSNFLTSGAKILLGRVRPELLFSNQEYGFHFFSTHNSGFSFPSGHACTIGAILGALACIKPTYTYLFVIMAILVSFIRVLQTYHFLSDVLAGVLIGVFVAQIVYTQMKSSKIEL